MANEIEEISQEEKLKDAAMAVEQADMMAVKPVSNEDFTEGQEADQERLDKQRFEEQRKRDQREIQSEDVEDLLRITPDIQPEEAARNIKGGIEYNVDPNTYAMSSETFNKNTEIEMLPKKVHRSVANVMAKSTHHSAIVKKDLPIWQKAQSQINFASDSIKGREISRKVYDLMSKKVLTGKLTEDESIDLAMLNAELKENAKIIGSYGFDFGQSLPGEIASGVVDFGRSIWSSKDTIGVGAAAGAAAFGAGAAFGGPLAAGTAALAGAASGGTLGLGAGLARDAFRQSSGEIYHELSDVTNQNATPLDAKKADLEMRQISLGGGVLMAGFELLPINKLAKNVPFLKKIISPRAAAKYLMRVEGAALRGVLKRIGSQAMTEGTTEAIQEIISIVSKDLGKTWDGSETKLLTALENTWKNRSQNAKQVAKAGIIGGVTGAVVTTAGNVAGATIEQGAKIIPKKAKPSVPPPAPTPPPSPVTDIVGQFRAADVKGTQAIQLKLLTEEHSKGTKNSFTAKNLPEDYNEIRQQMFEDAGISEVWLDKAELNAWATDEKKAKAAREAIDSSGVAAAEIDAPIRMDMAKFLKIVDEFPDAAELGKLDPESPSAKKWEFKLKEADANREALTKKLDEMQAQKPTPPVEGETPIKTEFKEGDQITFFDKGKKFSTKLERIGRYSYDKDGNVLHDYGQDMAFIVDNKNGITIPLNEIAFNNLPSKNLQKDLGIKLTEEYDLNGVTEVEVRNLLENYTDENKVKIKDIIDRIWEKNPKLKNVPKNEESLMGVISEYQIDDILEFIKDERNFDEKSQLWPEEVRNLFIENQDKYGGYVPSKKNVERIQKALKKSVSQENIPSPFPEMDFNPEQRLKDSDVFDEDSYLEQPTFTEPMYDVIPKAEALKLNQAQLEVRTEIADAINAEQEKHTNKVVDVEVEMNRLQEEEFQISQAERNEKIQVVESYLSNNKEIGELTDFQKSQKAAGKPIYAINPESLPEDMRIKYSRSKKIRERGVLDPQGMNVNDVAGLFGVTAPELMEMLAKTPTQEQAVEQAMKRREQQVRDETISNIDFDESRLAKAYNNATKNHIRELKILKDKYWSAMKTGIKRIALPLPTMQQLASRAREAVGSTVVKHLNVNQWKIAERRSQKSAVNSILKNEVEKAFTEKENAAYATQLTKETHVAISKVNNALKWIANLNSERVQAELKEAGDTYLKAVNELLGLYNFDPRQRNQENVDGYNKYVQKMLEKGQGDFTIPPEVQAWLTPAISAKELTVDQLLKVHDLLRSVVKQARLKNKLVRAVGKESVVDIIAENVETILKDHPSYDPKYAQDINRSVGLGEAATRLAGGLEAFTSNIKSITDILDQYKQSGFFNKLIWQAIEGTGVHEGPYGLIAKTKLQNEIKKKLEKGIKSYGLSNWKNLTVTKVFVPEFANSPGLSNGRVVKADLLQLLMNMGNLSSKNVVSNFGVDIETVWNVLKRELTKADFDFVQKNVWNLFRGLKDRVGATYKNMNDVDLQFLTPESFEAFGETYEGGYFPIKLKRDTSPSALEDVKAGWTSMTSNAKKAFVPPHPAFEGMVRDPMTKERVEHNYVVDLNIDNLAIGLDEVTHYITMTVPVRDTMTLLNDKQIANAIKSVVGISKYNVLHNSVASLTNSIGTQNLVEFSQLTKMIGKFFSRIEGAYIVSLLAGSPSTMLMQTLTLNEVTRVMGLQTGPKYLAKSIGTFLNPLNWNKWGAMIDFAAEKDSTIFKYREGLDDHSPSGLSKIMPKERLFQNKGYRIVKDSQESANDFLLSRVLGSFDTILKVSTFQAAYNQFLNGDAPNRPLDYLNNLSDADKATQAASYASAVLASTTIRASNADKSPVQKIPILKNFSRMFNEIRNVINNTIGDVRKNHYQAKEAVELAKEGNYLEANIAFHDVGYRMTMMLMIPMITMLVTGLARGKNPIYPEEEGEDLDDLNPMRIPEWVVSNLSTWEGIKDMSINGVGSLVPILRDMVWAGQTGRQTSTPLLGAFDHMKEAVVGGNAIFLRMMNDELNMIEAAEGLEPKQFKGMLYSLGILTGGLPVNALLKYDKLFSDDDGKIDITAPAGALVGTTLKAIDTFLEKFEKKKEDMTEDEQIDAAMKRIANKQASIVDQVKEIKENLVVDGDTEEPLADQDYEVIKYAESRGRWDAYSKSDAFGLYQFLEGTWDMVMNSPEGRAAKLTKKGWTSRPSTGQQEKAMRILTKMNARKLDAMGVPININTIYFAHHFGTKFAKDVWLSPDKTKLPKDLMTPQVVKNNNLQDVKTVADMKAYIEGVLDRGREGVEK